MIENFFGVPAGALAGQLLLGLINGGFYAMLSLGLAVIFGVLNIANFAHGAQYMLGAFVAWLLSQRLGIGYWNALWIAPLLVGALGLLIERFMLRRLAGLDHLYGLLLTLGIALLIEGGLRQLYGVGGKPYETPEGLTGGVRLAGIFLPRYRLWTVVVSVFVCIGAWLLLEKTSLGARLRAATENARITEAFGVNVPLLVTLTYGAGAALAAFAGVVAAPLYQVSALMGSNIVVIVFAVVVIGGMGSVAGAALGGFGLGLVEALTKIYYPPGSSTVIFVIMAVVLLLRPAGLFGKEETVVAPAGGETHRAGHLRFGAMGWVVLVVVALAAPFVLYPGFLAKALCFALFAAAFALLISYAGMVSFGHAAYFGTASYVCAHALKQWAFPPELAIATGAAAAAALGWVFGSIAVRRQGIYFAMVTLALAQVVYFAALQAPFTGGEDGIQAVPRGRGLGLFDLDSAVVLYYYVLGVCCLGLFAVWRVVHSPFGVTIRALKDNEARAISLGFESRRARIQVFVLSAALSGVAGATKVLVFQVASLTDVHWSTSGEVLLMNLVGGLGTLAGPALGALSLVALEVYFAEFGAWVTIIQGAVFVSCVMWLRQGLVGLWPRTGETRGGAG
jgi:branched-chain amino acid transport system permease protein